jgi:prevent-host-death family protein
MNRQAPKSHVLQSKLVEDSMEQRVSLREVNQHLTRYVKAAEAGERIVITRRGKPVALLSPLPWQGRSLTAAQEAALDRLLGQSHHLGGRAPSRDELYER